MNITNGSVSIEDGQKAKEEYAPARKVKVDLSFTVEEGADADATVKAAGDLAQAHVHRLIHTKAIPVAAHIAAAAPAQAQEVVPPKETAAAKKARIAAEAKPVLSDKDKLAQAQGLPVDDPLNGPAVPAKPAKDAPKPADENIDDLLGETAPKVVTDAELGAAAQKKMETMKEKAGWAPSKIRDLVKEIVKPEEGKVVQLKDVPQASRPEFLKRLSALA